MGITFFKKLLGFDAVLSLRPLPVRNCSGNTWSQGRPL